jgi:adenylate cyclase
VTAFRRDCRKPTNDQPFAAALKDTPSVLAIVLTGRAGIFVPKPKAGFAVAGDDPKRFVPDFPGAVGNLPMLEEAVAGLGSINWIPDRDQVLRRVALIYRIGDTFVPTLAVEALRVAQGASTYLLKARTPAATAWHGSGLTIRIGDLEIRPMPTAALAGKYRHGRRRSSTQLWRRGVEGDRFRIILVGTSAAGFDCGQLRLAACPASRSSPRPSSTCRRAGADAAGLRACGRTT